MAGGDGGAQASLPLFYSTPACRVVPLHNGLCNTQRGVRSGRGKRLRDRSPLPTVFGGRGDGCLGSRAPAPRQLVSWPRSPRVTSCPAGKAIPLGLSK